MSVATFPAARIARLTAVELAIRALSLLLFPETRLAIGAEAARRIRALESETPRAGTPGVSLSAHLEKDDMATVSDSTLHAMPHPCAPLADIGSAQHTALLRWHNRRPMFEVMDDLESYPRFPCVRNDAPLDGAA